MSCPSCRLRRVCLPPELSNDELEWVGGLVSTRLRLRRGASLYQAGDAFESLYAVWLGTLKITVATHRSRERVTGFRVGGDMIGFDGLSGGSHMCSAVALEDSTVCVLPYRRLEEAVATVPALRQHLLRVMSGDITRQNRQMLMLGSMQASERLAGFLVDLSDRSEARGYSSRELALRMTRAEIGSFLRLRLDTVSRLMWEFSRLGLIEVRQAKQIRLCDPGKLRRMAMVATRPGPDSAVVSA